MSMRLGYSITSAHSREKPAEQAVEEVLDRVRTARDAGVDYVQAGDHHATPYHYLQNVPVSARIAAEIDRVASLFLLPLYNPVLVAEQAGTLDAVAPEFDFWCALGWREAAFDAHGVPYEERAPRFEEALELIQRLWTEDEVDHDGRFYEAEGVSVNPKADAVRTTIGGSAEPAVRRAGRLGDAWAAGPTETLADLERKYGWAREEANGDGDPDLVVRRDAMILEDGDDARERADEMLAEGYRGWDEDAPYLLVGSPEEVAGDLDALADIGVDEVVVRPMDDEHAAATLEGFGRAGAIQ